MPFRIKWERIVRESDVHGVRKPSEVDEDDPVDMLKSSQSKTNSRDSSFDPLPCINLIKLSMEIS